MPSQLLKAAFSIAALLSLPVAAAENEVNLYSAQQEHLIRPVLQQFEEQTGVSVNMTTGDKAALVSRLAHEGEHTPADLLLTVDIGNIHQAKEKGLLRPVESDVLKRQIPANLRDPEGQWYGLTTRARAIFYNKELVDPVLVQSYADLARPELKDGVLIRSSDNVYNQSLVASVLAHEGEEATREWLDGLVGNMARAPQGGDTEQLTALAAGEGKVAVANTYYYGRLVNPELETYDPEVAEKIGIIFPDQDGRGTHVNIRGGAVTRHAKNPEHAVQLLEFLASDQAQRFFAESNMEYPAKAGVPAPEAVEGWGDFKRDDISLEMVGQHQQHAIRLMDAAGWK